jgi:fibronectin-binding autotransporter adhesin
MWLAAAVPATAVPAVHGAVVYVGQDTTNAYTWSKADNWSPNGVPGGSNNVLFDDAGDANLNGNSIGTGSNQSALSLSFGDNSGDTLTQSFTLTGNTITLGLHLTGTSPTGLTRTASGTQTIASKIALGQSQQWFVGGTGSLIVTGVISDGGAGYGITKTSGGVLELSAANTFSGQFTVQGGTVLLDNAGGLGTDTTDPVLLNAPASTSNATLSLSNNVQFNSNLLVQANNNGKNVTIGGGPNLNTSAGFGGTVTLDQGLQLDVLAGGTVTVSGVIQDGTVPGTVAKIDGGTVVLSAANTFSGGYTARGGTTVVANNGALGSATTALVSGVSATSAASLLTSAGITLGQAITVQSSVNTAGPGGASQQYGATLGGQAGQGASAWTGPIALNQPTTLSGNVTFSGTIADGVGGMNSTGTPYVFISSNVTKSDAGTTTVLSGSNTYSGTTTITAGTLRADNPAGSATGTGAVTVSGAGTLGGNGAIAGTVTVAAGGTITAGADVASTGNLSTGAQAWNAGGAYVAKFAANGSSNDALVMTGLTVNGAFNVSAAVIGGGPLVLPLGDRLILAVDTESATTNPLASGVPADLTLVAPGITATDGSAPMLETQLDANGSSYDLVLATAPEPTSALLLGVAAAPLGLARRRRGGKVWR